MVYDATDESDFYAKRYARIQKLEWRMNSPVFPIAAGRRRELKVPSGE